MGLFFTDILGKSVTGFSNLLAGAQLYSDPIRSDPISNVCCLLALLVGRFQCQQNPEHNKKQRMAKPAPAAAIWTPPAAREGRGERSGESNEGQTRAQEKKRRHMQPLRRGPRRPSSCHPCESSNGLFTLQNQKMMSILMERYVIPSVNSGRRSDVGRVNSVETWQ